MQNSLGRLIEPTSALGEDCAPTSKMMSPEHAIRGDEGGGEGGGGEGGGGDEGGGDEEGGGGKGGKDGGSGGEGGRAGAQRSPMQTA